MPSVRELAKEGAKEGVFEALEEVNQNEETKESQEVVESLLSTIPKTPDYYLKLYKTKPLPPGIEKSQFKTEIMNLQEIDDLEIYIRNLVRDHNWGPGEYMVATFGIDPRTGKKLPGIRRRPVRLSIDYETPQIPPPQPSIKDKLSDVKDIVTTVKEFLPPPVQVPQINPADLSKTLADTLKTGVEIARSNKEGGNGPDTTVRTIELLEKLGVIRKEEQKREFSIVEVLTVLKEIGVIGKEEKKVDIWQEIARMRELGLIPSFEKEKSDVISDVQKLQSLIQVITPLINPATEKTSLGVEIIRTIGPHIPEMVRDITEAINNVAEASKITRGYIPPKKPVSPQMTQVEQKSIETHVADPILKEIQSAVEKGDRNYFQKLKEIITLYTGQNTIDYLVNDQVSQETFLSIISSRAGEFFSSDKAKKYLSDFIEWERLNRSNLTIAECDKCKEVWEFSSLQDFEMSEKLCECGGTLHLIQK